MVLDVFLTIIYNTMASWNHFYLIVIISLHTLKWFQINKLQVFLIQILYSYMASSILI